VVEDRQTGRPRAEQIHSFTAPVHTFLGAAPSWPKPGDSWLELSQVNLHHGSSVSGQSTLRTQNITVISGDLSREATVWFPAQPMLAAHCWWQRLFSLTHSGFCFSP